MNYTIIKLSFFIGMATNSVAIPSVKVMKKVVDLAGLTAMLQRQGYTVLSANKEKFEAQKEHPAKLSIHNSVVTQRTESCKITQLEEDDFFVEVGRAEVREVLGEYQQGSLFTEEGFELREESCDSHKQTAYVFTFERALEVAVLFLKHKK